MMRFNTEGVISEVSDMPGCAQVAVSHYVWLPKGERGRGVGSAVHALRMEKLIELGYDYVLCTVESTNEAQIKILRKGGWEPLADFISAKTGHHVIIAGKLLGERGPSDIPVDDLLHHDRFVAQKQQFQNVPSDVEERMAKCTVNCEEYPPCKCKEGCSEHERCDAETAIHEEMQRVRKET